MENALRTTYDTRDRFLEVDNVYYTPRPILLQAPHSEAIRVFLLNISRPLASAYQPYYEATLRAG